MALLFEIMRQRFFMDHSSRAKTFVTEEYTIRSLAKNLDNIVIIKKVFLPNLHVYDSDGELLPIVNNDLTLDLLRRQRNSSSDPEIKKKIEYYIDKVEKKELFVIWVKLPPTKRMSMNQIKVISFEYDAKRRKKLSPTIKTSYRKNLGHSVFLIIKKPEDYEFKERPSIGWLDYKNEYKRYDDWQVSKDAPAHISETVYALSIAINPRIVYDMSITYSFVARRDIVSFPLITLGLLSLTALTMTLFAHWDALHIQQPMPISSADELLAKKIEVGFAIVAASLVLPGLIKNDGIRNDYKVYFLIPIGLAVSIFI